MALSMNKVILIGNVGQDPDVRTIPSGARVCKISVATTENYKDKSGEWVDSTEWHRVVLWDYLADRAEKYLKRGSKVCIEGKNKTTKYEKDGVTHYTTEVIARDLILLDPKNRDGGGVSDSGSSYSATSPKTTPESDADGDDDIPF